MKRQRHFPSANPADDAPSSNMSAKRPKIDRVSTAAFAASQPLFDTLRNARERLPDQGMHLTMAANLVQQIHVGLKIEDGNNDIERHAKYMDAIVEAWRCATDTYCEVFSHLATITAEKPEEGRRAAASHVHFEKMLESAQLAQKLAKEFTLAREKPDLPIVSPKPNLEVEVEDDRSEVDEPPSSSLFPPSQATPTPAAKKSIPTTKYDQSGLRLLWEDGQLRVPMGTLTKAERKQWAAVQKLAGRADHKKKISQVVKSKHANGVNGVSEATSPQANGVNEEAATADVKAEVNDEATAALAAEVEARIKAKEEARAAKKAEKKRKRESGDSFVAADDAPEAIQTAISARPKKKKVKKSNHNPEQPAEAGANTKRKGSVDEGTVEGDKPTKKQKKNKNKG
ncbi:hypothetical protein Slin15195_G036940 [Septoria linicola]|uniref:Uncharacterized protein n=1 Tax=Septoria linicola TaxID=215465 RepID=A0A9Q9AJV8_9PEZI|nr:hypothetical protein Slin15195_G036940 [Septoria linicola]